MTYTYTTNTVRLTKSGITVVYQDASGNVLPDNNNQTLNFQDKTFSVSNGFSINGNYSTIHGNNGLYVDQTSYFNGAGTFADALNVQGGLSVGTLGVTGPVNLYSTLHAVGPVTFDNNLNVQGNVGVTGAVIRTWSSQCTKRSFRRCSGTVTPATTTMKPSHTVPLLVCDTTGGSSYLG